MRLRSNRHVALLLGLVGACVVFRVACGADYDVYVLTGQSNSLGTTGSGDPQTLPGTAASDPQAAFFWANVTSANGVYPPTLYGSAGGAIQALQVQQGDGGANATFWGPEFGFSRTLAEVGGRVPLIIKASRGGGSNLLWDKAAFTSSPDSGHMWGHLRDTVDAALAALAPGDTFRLKGLLYLQGESNSSADASSAGQRLESLASNLAAHVEAAHPGTAAGMRTVVEEIAASAANATRIATTSSQRALATTSDTVAFVGTSDLPLKSDGIHFGGGAKLEIGRRMANAMAGRGLTASSFAAVSGTAGARSLVFDLAVPDANGATNGVIRSFSNPNEGFVTGTTSQAPAGVLVEGSAGAVVFADYYASLVSSDLAAGGQLANPNSGQSLTFTFVDPATRSPAAVAGVAFELRAAAGDGVTATFEDVDGIVLQSTGVLADGRYGYESFDSFSGLSRSLIHRVVLSGSPGTLWTVGSAGDTVTPDFAFSGFAVVPEPSVPQFIAVVFVAVAVAIVVRDRRTPHLIHD
jgi:hypothetical protein